MKVTTLLRADWRLIRRDGIVFMAWLGPLALLLFLAVALPIGQRYVDVSAFLPWVAGFAAALVPYIPGAGVGFMLLDEMDHGLIRFYSISPLGLRGYVFYRLIAAWLPAVVYLALLPILLPWVQGSIAVYVLQAGAAALGAPLMALAIGVLAGNRVEGLAVSKGLGVTLAAPLLPLWVAAPWWWPALLLPPYWVVHGVVRLVSGEGSTIAAATGSVIAHGLWLGVLLRQLNRKVL